MPKFKYRTSDGRAAIPYVIEEVTGAEHLLVAFPKLRPGGAKPPVAHRTMFEPLRAHRLFVGSDEHTYIGPRRSMGGADAVVDLIHREAQRLDVPMENVIATGTSMGAICALYLGLRAETGQVFAGAPPARMGTLLQKLAKVDGPTHAAKAGAADFLALAETTDAETTAAEFLDRLIFDAAESATHRATIHLIVSPSDKLYQPTRELAKALVNHPTIDCVFAKREYGRHAEIKDAFPPYLVERLPELSVYCEDEPWPDARLAPI